MTSSLLFLLLLYPLSTLSSSGDPAPISSIIPATTTALQDSTDDLIESSQLAAPASAAAPPAFPHYTILDTAQLPGDLVSFTGGKGNYRSMAREFVSSHNQVRSTVHEHPFVWDRQLARFAKRWSEKLRATCLMEHSMGPYGENMLWGSGWGWRAADAVSQWALERDFYNPGDNSCAPGQMCGHFTQIIWNSTVRIGCGRSECYGGGVIMTCNYDPPGNYVGENPLTAV